MEDGGYGFPVGEAGLTGGLAGLEGPMGIQEVRWRTPVWSPEVRAWDGSVEHGMGTQGKGGQ